MDDEPMRASRTFAAPSSVRSPSVAEIIAGELRHRIVQGELADGDLLPKQEELLAEFGVSKPSVREALRILETEGLVSVRRGKFGGAVVHRPRVDNAAYVLELILRSQSVPVDDVAAALRHFEPICASLCAMREDRETTVLPRLRAVHEQARESIDDVRRFTELARRFHEEMVASCGNETIILIIGALETIWSAHAAVWTDESLGDGAADENVALLRPDYRHHGLEDHDLILRLIERGDAEGAAREARQHLEWTPTYNVQEDRAVPALLGGPNGSVLSPPNQSRRTTRTA